MGGKPRIAMWTSGSAWIVALAAALSVFSDTLRWLWRVPFSGADRRLNLAILLLFIALIGHRLWQSQRQQKKLSLWRPAGRLRVAPLLCFSVATALHAIVCHTLAANTLSAVLFLLAAYGFVGLFLSPLRFATGLSGLLLLIAALPFAALAEGYIGLGARLLTAEVVQQLLSTLHIAVLPAHTILVLERGIAHVDIPCSGLRGLWSGLLAYLLLTWLDRRRIGGRWGLGLLAMQALLLGANIARVFVLVYVAQVAAAPRLAEALHVPLGLVGFTGALALAYVFLRHGVPTWTFSDDEVNAERSAAPAQSTSAATPSTASRERWLAPAVAAFLLTICLVERGLPASTATGSGYELTLPSELAPIAVALTPGEREIFSRFGARAEKWRLRGGSLIVVQAPGLSAFRAHHPPEVCLLASGLRVTQAQSVALAPAAYARLLTLQDGAAARPGIYWFQSKNSTTPDILTRIYRQLVDRKPWLLVTLLGDASTPPAEFLALSQRIHATLTQALSAPPATGVRP